MIDKIHLHRGGVPPVMPVMPVGDRSPRPHYPRTHAERVKPNAASSRDEFIATGEKAASQKPLVYDRSVQWQQQLFTEDADKGQAR